MGRGNVPDESAIRAVRGLTRRAFCGAFLFLRGFGFQRFGGRLLLDERGQLRAQAREFSFERAEFERRFAQIYGAAHGFEVARGFNGMRSAENRQRTFQQVSSGSKLGSVVLSDGSSDSRESFRCIGKQNSGQRVHQLLIAAGGAI